MPFEHKKSQKAFEHNLKAEMHAGKPQKQSLAIAYAVKRRAKKAMGGMYAHGGQIKDNYQSPKSGSHQDIFHDIGPHEEQESGFVDHEGNDVKHNGPASAESARGLGQHGAEEQGPYSTRMKDGGLVDSILESLSGKKDGKDRGMQNTEDSYSDYTKDTRKKHATDDYTGYEHHAEGGKVGGAKTSTTGNKTKTGGSNPGGASTGGAGTVTITTRDLGSKGINVSNVGGKTAARNAGGMDPSDEDDDMMMAEGGQITDNKQSKEHQLDMVGRIMKQRQNHYSEGGKVANNDHSFEYEFETPDEFDDLVLRDDLESHYGDDDNSGDALGNKGEDERRKDIVAKIMKSRRLKDRNPNPA